ncbi:MAG: hypothetical protein O3B65_05545 [Chloroflexi bacterium]|nr:hypothetical protein [Chloroflexota bacterium]
MDEIITMEDMASVYEVLDELGIDRESINVELGKEDPGSWAMGDGGMMRREVIEITLPLTTPLDEWLPTLKAGLQKLTGGNS